LKGMHDVTERFTTIHYLIWVLMEAVGKAWGFMVSWMLGTSI
jgi:phosphopantetheinyl transferase